MEAELRSIKDQMRSDFQSVMTALATQRDAVSGGFRSISRKMDEIAQEMASVSGALAEQEQVLEGYIERTDARLDQIIDRVADLQDWRGMVNQRLDALERKQAG